jgi:hypothetical protein
LRRIVNWIIGVPVAAIIIGFAIANRQWQQVSFDPFSQAAPFASITMPLWALLFCGIFLGILAGWAGCWLAQSKWRKAAREARIDLERAQREIRGLKDAAPPPPANEMRNLPMSLGTEPF